MDANIVRNTVLDTDKYIEGIVLWEFGIGGVSWYRGKQRGCGKDWEADLYYEEEVCEQL